MRYISTRGQGETFSSSQAIVKGISDDGGLFVPQTIPTIRHSLSELAKLDYVSHAYASASPYLTDFDSDELRACISAAYSSNNFDTPDIALLVQFPEVSFLELFHGKTLAFKDMALSLLPHLMTRAAAKIGDKRTHVILTATSGDTGKAALEGFKDVDGTIVIVFYPENGVSVLQQRLMTTQEGSNVFTIGVKGNFDDAQSEVKRIFSDQNLAARLDDNGFALSSANSINVGRLIPQVAYYFYVYSQFVAAGMSPGEEISFVVPTGNFGNILAGYYAKQMGLPVRKLICASNDNNVLCDFFRSGAYDINRKFFSTISPSMDILISSNFERLAFDLLGKSADALKDRVMKLSSERRYILDTPADGFIGFTATEAETIDSIRRVYKKYDYVIDPHTAVAYSAFEKYAPQERTVILSTASPYKFTKTVMSALDPKYAAFDDFELIARLAELNNEPIPTQIARISEKPVLHESVVEINQMKDAVVKAVMN